jgi:hypothetical protein
MRDEPPIEHRMLCDPSTAVVVEAVVRDAVGHGRVVMRCQGCGAETETPT